ncbi:MAG: tRNA uridine-5-carboxymethylaminomethyl(34) synthesis GTPase MnmE [Desulfovibrio sp.]|uniref:tRNA uridine-5-carboxymethylaminomethyl(34) synthesis GTPase MnmE n=1 Tax=Desulfovibrio sp. 7SRBS1 TaxID=3378064 RepID=UPI003B3F975F
MHPTHDDTIAAIATPPGRGGVGIIRISGPLARQAGHGMFRSVSPNFKDFDPYRLHYGHLHAADGTLLDEAMVVYMPAPNSFTGDDVLEMHCHGSPAVLRLVLESLFSAGIRPAGPGEFTYRAFMNGRMDLSRAEAVAELIDAPTSGAAMAAAERLEGTLGRQVAAMRESLSDLRAQLCLAVDFPEDDVECLPLDDFADQIASVRREIQTLVQAFARTRLQREGALVVLAGRVNAGKSSLLNALIGRDRAIVTDVPGTTRDFIEEQVDLAGMAVRLVDTAGLRRADDAVEAEGVRRSLSLLADADLILLVIDAAAPLSDEDIDLYCSHGPEKVLAVCNKMDRTDLPEASCENIEKKLTKAAGGPSRMVRISAETGAGLDALEGKIAAMLGTEAKEQDTRVVPNARQSQILERALSELEELSNDIGAELPYDILGVRLESATAILEEITGEIAPQDVLDRIFSRFCIGK